MESKPVFFFLFFIKRAALSIKTYQNELSAGEYPKASVRDTLAKMAFHIPVQYDYCTENTTIFFEDYTVHNSLK